MSPYNRLRTVRRATVTASAVLGTCAALVTAGPGAASAGSGAASGIRYVALGDSYASGYGITPVQDARCGRGATNYPSVLRAVAQPQSYQNVACSGATTRSIWNAEGGEPKQISALKKDTSLVTVTIGGNDIGFTELVTTCATLGLRQPTGDPCRQTYKEGTADKILTRLDAVKSRFADVVTDVKRKSPEATVALVAGSVLPGEICTSFDEAIFGWMALATPELYDPTMPTTSTSSANRWDAVAPLSGLASSSCASIVSL